MGEYRFESVPVAAVLFGLLGTLFAVGIGALLIGRWVRGIPASAVWGLSGAIGLGAIGLLTFLAGLAGTFAHSWFFYVGAVVWVAVGGFGLLKHRNDLSPKEGTDSQTRIIVVIIVLFLLLRLPAVFTPSAGADWDTTSHQLAMSKIWLLEGKVSYLAWMNHSNIPATVNMLYIWGLEFGGQAGAKMIAWCFAILACLGVGGLVAHKFGKIAGLWSALAFICVPVTLWEPGTAYQDVIHGFYGGAAIVLTALYVSDSEKKWLYLAGVILGLSLATKYTGFQVAFAIVAALLLVGLFGRSTRKSAMASASIVVIALVVASPWYLRNVINTGNPVYPFFYSVFGGSDWTQDMAHAYATEQKTFGVWTFDGSEYQEAYKGADGKSKHPLVIPGAITALAVQPHKQINGGAFWGAMGGLLALSMLLWCFSGRMRKEHAFCVLAIFICLLSWFYLTQQSRYIIALMVPGAFLLGGAISKLPFKSIAIAAIGIQSAFTFFWFAGVYTLFVPGATSEFGNAIKFVSSGKPDSAYLSGGDFGGGPMRRFPFWEATAFINEMARAQPEMRVALLDEVRGFYLDVEYYWASPGFSLLIPWNDISKPEQLIDALAKLKTTHVYLNYDQSVIGGREQALQIAYAFSPELFARSPGDDKIAPFRKVVIEAYRAGLLRKVATFDQPAIEGAVPLAVLLEVVDKN
ncbi:MAG: glycosyltransferase family 39 protein [Fimbriimonadales bacterium]|nr:glycosyltransferase family 39 protein [Fimbriimonadales bacterium]